MNRALKPEYFLQPFRVLKKALGFNKELDVWGLKMVTFPNDYLVRAIKRTGIYDLAATELLFRLSKGANVLVDAGANIGLMSRTMLLGGSRQTVLYSFEPNPEVLELLYTNRRNTPGNERWKIEQAALTSIPQRLFIKKTSAYHHNKGTASVSTTGEGDFINGVPLDDYFRDSSGIDVLKIDVEGHELQVLEGGARLLSEKKIKHIVFEDFKAYPSQVMELLIHNGYTILAIRKGMFGVQLYPPETAPPLPAWEEPNYLATINLPEVKSKLNRSGYACLSYKPNV